VRVYPSRFFGAPPDVTQTCSQDELLPAHKSCVILPPYTRIPSGGGIHEQAIWVIHCHRFVLTAAVDLIPLNCRAGNEFRGFHIRFRDVARGGIRIVRSRNKEYGRHLFLVA
jgi:hypothetical protein